MSKTNSNKGSEQGNSKSGSYREKGQIAPTRNTPPPPKKSSQNQTVNK